MDNPVLVGGFNALCDLTPDPQRLLDALHELPYTREPHPRYASEGDAIPAWQTIKDSVQIMRGCFGGCTFCSITMHQGRAIQSRSHDSVLREVRELASRPGFKGHVSAYQNSCRWR